MLLGAADSILYQMSLQFDGNVVVYRKSNIVALWNSGRYGNGPWKLKLQLGTLMNVLVLQIRAALGCHDFGGALLKRYNRRSWRMDCCFSPFC